MNRLRQIDQLAFKKLVEIRIPLTKKLKLTARFLGLTSLFLLVDHLRLYMSISLLCVYLCISLWSNHLSPSTRLLSSQPIHMFLSLFCFSSMSYSISVLCCYLLSLSRFSGPFDLRQSVFSPVSLYIYIYVSIPVLFLFRV